jgi:enamine deaminase RidA (YjgF/YER057c/UK114 family)
VTPESTTEPRPDPSVSASTAVQVSPLAMPDFMIEIETWAVCAD